MIVTLLTFKDNLLATNLIDTIIALEDVIFYT